MREFRFVGAGMFFFRLLVGSVFVCGSIGVSWSSGQELDELLEIPKLRFLASSHPPRSDQSLPPAGNYWTPDGRKVNDEEELVPIQTVQGYSSGTSPYLFLFFTHSDFHDPFARVSIETADGLPIDPAMAEKTSVHVGKGAIALAVLLPSDVSLPASGTVRLKYTVGDWTRVDSIPSDLDPAPLREYDGANLLAIGESTSKLSFATLLVRDGLNSEFQYFVCATIDGENFIEPGRKRTLFKPAFVQTFVFRKPLAEIQSFVVEKRKVKESIYSGVSLVATEVAE